MIKNIINNNSKKVKSVKEIRKLIDKVMLPGYTYRTNFSYSDSLIFINNSLSIAAKLVELDNKMVYEFVLDTQFVSNQEVKYQELVMLSNIIDILECNRTFVLSRLKKYTVDEWKKEEEERKKQSEAMLEALKKFVENRMKNNRDY